MEYLDFKSISEVVRFKAVFDWLNIPYTSTDKELKGDGFIVNIEKNLFIDPKNKERRGSVINFYSRQKEIDLRTAAAELKHTFMNGKVETSNDVKPVELPDLTLEYHDMLKGYGFSKEFCEKYEVGYVKQKSIMAGKIAFRVRDRENKATGYVGVSMKDASWLFPKNFTLSVYNLHRCLSDKAVMLVVNPLDALRLISFGWNKTVAILTPSITKGQEEQLKTFKSILVIHKEPDNIITRLSSQSFVKKIVPTKELALYTKEEFAELIS